MITHYLERLGLANALHKRATELSKGMQQRVGIARAFALFPKLLLLDEPFGMLDFLTRWDLQEVLMEVWTRNQVTAIIVTHNVDEAILLADRVVMMTNGPRARTGRSSPSPCRARARDACCLSTRSITLCDRALSPTLRNATGTKGYVPYRGVHGITRCRHACRFANNLRQICHESALVQPAFVCLKSSPITHVFIGGHTKIPTFGRRYGLSLAFINRG